MRHDRAMAGLSRAVARRCRHREEMQLALAEGLSLDAARERLASFEAHRPRLDAPAPSEPPDPFPEWTDPAELAAAEERPLPWWQRD